MVRYTCVSIFYFITELKFNKFIYLISLVTLIRYTICVFMAHCTRKAPHFDRHDLELVVQNDSVTAFCAAAIESASCTVATIYASI